MTAPTALLRAGSVISRARPAGGQTRGGSSADSANPESAYLSSRASRRQASSFLLRTNSFFQFPNTITAGFGEGRPQPSAPSACRPDSLGSIEPCKLAYSRICRGAGRCRKGPGEKLLRNGGSVSRL